MIEYYINELLSEGITSIPPWKAPKRGRRKTISPVKEEDPASLLTETLGSQSARTTSSVKHERHPSDSSSSKCSLQLGATAANMTDDEILKGKGDINALG